MARKTKAEAAKTRRNILDAAFAVFSDKGFMRTTLRDIASAAGVTRGAIYWHFKDKVDLFLALSEEIAASAAARPEDVREDRVQSLEDLKRDILNYLVNFETNPRYAVFYELMNYRTEYTRELEPVRTRQREQQREILQRAGAMFVRLKAHGAVRCDLDPACAALSLLAWIVGLVEIWLSDPASFSITETAPALLDHFFRGIRP